MSMYTLEYLRKPIILGEVHPGHNILEKSIIDGFHEEMPYACLDDIPYIEYNPDTGEVEVDDVSYEVDRELQEYLKEANLLLNTVPLPKIKLKRIEIHMTHPEEEGEKGKMKIGCVRTPSTYTPVAEQDIENAVSN